MSAPSSGLVIAGCGLLGTSVAGAARVKDPQQKIIGIEPDPSARNAASALSVYDALVADVAEVEQHLESVPVEGRTGIAATPPAELAHTMTDLAQVCALVMDVGSIKAGVVAQLEALGPPGPGIVPCHPMAGSHEQGPAAGQAELFQGRWVFVVPMASSAQQSVLAAHEFWQGLGAQTTEIDAAEHDVAVAYTSHLPHLLSSAYMSVDTPLTAAAGTGYMEFTRLAKANPVMWSQVLLSNAPAVKGVLDRLLASLSQVSSLIDSGDSKALTEWLAEQKEQREQVQRNLDDSAASGRSQESG